MYIGVGKFAAQGSYACKRCTAISFTPVHASTFPHQRETMKTSEQQLAPSHSGSAHFSLLAMTKARCVTRNDWAVVYIRHTLTLQSCWPKKEKCSG